MSSAETPDEPDIPPSKEEARHGVRIWLTATSALAIVAFLVVMLLR